MFTFIATNNRKICELDPQITAFLKFTTNIHCSVTNIFNTAIHNMYNLQFVVFLVGADRIL